MDSIILGIVGVIGTVILSIGFLLYSHSNKLVNKLFWWRSFYKWLKDMPYKKDHQRSTS